MANQSKPQTGPLLATLRSLRETVEAEAEQRLTAWQPQIVMPEFGPDAANLAAYLAFRHHDLRGLQRELMRLGLSSLGRLESRVMVHLRTVEAALAMLTGEARDADWPPAEAVYFAGETRLRANTAALLGGEAARDTGRIMVTLAEDAAEDPDYMADLIGRGADVARINCAHDSTEIWAAMIANTRHAERAVGRHIPILMDLAGPKLRTGAVKRHQHYRLFAGDHFRLVAGEKDFGDDHMIEAVSDPALVITHAAVGDEVVFDDGKLSARIESRTPRSLSLQVIQVPLEGFKMKPERGFSFPGRELPLDTLTAKDLADLDFIALYADMVGFSFVQSAQDIAQLQAELAKRRSDWQKIGLVAKIETAQAVQNLPGIIVQAAGAQKFGVMIARGDLAVSIGFQRLAEMQEEILWLCEAARVPVIWATQVLEEMVKSGQPTRGEMTDAVMAGRAECVMLNKGPNVDKTISTLQSLLQRMNDHQSKKTALLRALRSW